MDDKLMPNKKTVWGKDDPLVVELINQLRFKITGSEDTPMSLEDFSTLHEDILNKCKTKIDDRTLKEYFGYYSSRTGGCSLNILNAFAVYLGYKNFYTFKKEIENNLKKNDNWISSSKIKEAPKIEDNKVEKKKTRIILFIVFIVAFLGLLLLIHFDRTSIKNNNIEALPIDNQEIILKDSFQSDKENEAGLDKISTDKAKKLNSAETRMIETTQRVDVYINDYNNKFDIAVLIVNDNRQQENEISSQIAAIYSNQGYSVSYSFFTTNFIQSHYLTELQNANSQTIHMLDIDSQIKKIILGEVTYTFREGSLVAGTTICNAKINMNIISVDQKSLIYSFSFSVNANGVSKLQAKEQALNRLFFKYKEEYSSL